MLFERVREIIAECTEDTIEEALVELQPLLAPYFAEGEYDERFTKQFRKMVKLPLPTKHLSMIETVKTILSGPTYKEEQDRLQQAIAEEKQAIHATYDRVERNFVTGLLTRLGFRKGDQIVVHRNGSGGFSSIDLDEWDLPVGDCNVGDCKES
jgi:hypothetical protein